VDAHPSSSGTRRPARRTPFVLAVAAAALMLLPLPPAASAAQPEPQQDRTQQQPQEQPQADWLQAPALQARLAAGKVVMRSALDERAARASVDAAIRVHASPQSIWELITQCRYAPILIPGLRHCKELSAATDGSWAVVEHDIKYAPLLPMVHSIFRADYQPPLRMDFHRIAGDLKDESGSWILRPAADGTTTVEYRVSIKPGFWVPHSMIRKSLRKQLPAALDALRAHVEAEPAAKVASTGESTDRGVPVSGTQPPLAGISGDASSDAAPPATQATPAPSTSPDHGT
jgi:Polyketide cyclase / dehydrase and lipid transport